MLTDPIIRMERGKAYDFVLIRRIGAKRATRSLEVYKPRLGARVRRLHELDEEKPLSYNDGIRWRGLLQDRQRIRDGVRCMRAHDKHADNQRDQAQRNNPSRRQLFQHVGEGDGRKQRPSHHVTGTEGLRNE